MKSSFGNPITFCDLIVDALISSIKMTSLDWLLLNSELQ